MKRAFQILSSPRALLAYAVLLLAGCGRVGGTMQMPEQASKIAVDMDWMYYYIFWLCVIFFVQIMAMLAWFAWKYRRRPGHEPQPSPHHNLALEIAWTIPPVLLVITMFYWGFTDYVKISEPPDNAYRVEVMAKKWVWNFAYPNGGTDSILHVPPDQPLQVLMESNDVLHSFFVPEMRVKKDVVPGRVTTIWFEANMDWVKTRAKNRKGEAANLPYVEYTLFCTEYCGRDHSRMRAPVRVYLTRKAFEEAVKSTSVKTPYKVYAMNCKSCHTTDGTLLTGPTFKGLWGSKRKVFDPAKNQESEITADEAYVRESILVPGKLLSRMGKEFADEMSAQGFAEKLSKEDLEMAIEFLKDPEAAIAADAKKK